MLGIVKDNPTALTQTINYAINNADIVISSGGVSVGDYDYIDKIYEENAAKPNIEITNGSIDVRNLTFGA